MDLFFFEMLADFGGDIDDVAKSGCVLGYFVGANLEHANSIPQVRLETSIL